MSSLATKITETILYHILLLNTCMEDQAVLGSKETAASMCVDPRGLGWFRSAALIATPRNWLKKALIIMHGLKNIILGRFTRSTQTLL